MGLKGSNLRYPNGDQAYVVGATFLAQEVTGQLRTDGYESRELRFFSPDAWPAGLNRYNRRLLNRWMESTATVRY